MTALKKIERRREKRTSSARIWIETQQNNKYQYLWERQEKDRRYALRWMNAWKERRSSIKRIVYFVLERFAGQGLCSALCVWRIRDRRERWTQSTWLQLQVCWWWHTREWICTLWRKITEGKMLVRCHPLITSHFKRG